MRLAITDKFPSLIPAILAGLLTIGLLVQTKVYAQQDGASTAAKATQTDEQQADNQQGKSVISGRVLYADSNRPLRRAEVSLFDAEAGEWEDTVPTDRRGVFTFEQVPAGRYVVVAEAPGIISPNSFLSSNDSLMTKIMLGEIKDGFSEVTVDGKRRVETEVRVRRGGVITGRVTTDDDDPVSGADVKLFKRERGRFVQVASTWNLRSSEKRALQTDSRGVYRIAGLPAGEYVVRVSEAEISTDRMGTEMDAYGDGSLVVAYYPAATSLRDAQTVTVLEGNESTGIDVRMPARETHKIGGRVIVSPEGAPAGYVDIKIDRVDERLPRPALSDVNARTDAEGKWEIDGIPDGEYILTVNAGLGARVGSPESGGWVKVAPKRFTVKVEGADVTGLETRLAEGASLSGKVIVEGGKELPDALLSIELIPAADNKRQASGGVDVEEVDRTSVLDEGGAFGMEAVPAGRYYFRLRGIPVDRYYVKALARGGADMMRSPFKLDEGQNLTGIEVKLATDVATIEGRATLPAANGKPSGTVVLLMPVDAASRRFIDGLITTRADEQGRFTLKAPPGEYFIAALIRQQGGKEAVKIDEDALMKEQSRLRRITVRPGERVKLQELVVVSF